METVVLRAFDREIVADGERIEFRKRPSGGVVDAVAIAVIAACAYGAGHALRSAGDAYRALGSFIIGMAGLMAIVGVLAIALAILLFVVPGRRVFARSDPEARTFRVRGRDIPFADIQRFSFLPSGHGMRALCVETAGAGTITVWVATRNQWQALVRLAARLEGGLGQPDGTAPRPAATTAAAAAPLDQRFRTTVILVTGAVWTIGGWFFFRGLSFTSRLDPEGLQIPVWCAGPAILAFGVFDWLRSRRR